MCLHGVLAEGLGDNYIAGRGENLLGVVRSSGVASCRAVLARDLWQHPGRGRGWQDSFPASCDVQLHRGESPGSLENLDRGGIPRVDLDREDLLTIVNVVDAEQPAEPALGCQDAAEPLERVDTGPIESQRAHGADIMKFSWQSLRIGEDLVRSSQQHGATTSG